MKVFQADLGVWIGPHRTTAGEHWFRIKDRFAEVSPAFDAMIGQVRFDWVSEKEEAAPVCGVAKPKPVFVCSTQTRSWIFTRSAAKEREQWLH